jgi:hypothetical protein
MKEDRNETTCGLLCISGMLRMRESVDSLICSTGMVLRRDEERRHARACGGRLATPSRVLLVRSARTVPRSKYFCVVMSVASPNIPALIGSAY